MIFKKLLQYKFTYLILGALIAAFFSYLFNAKLIEKEYFYKMKSEKQNFVFELTHMLQKRIYNAEVFSWNIINDARKETILKSWERYREITIDWNEKLQNYYLKLDMYFPKNRYLVSNYSNFLGNDLSFKNFLKEEIQMKIIPIHTQLVELKKEVIKNNPLDSELLKQIGEDIEKLHAKIANFTEAIIKATNE